jgi:hypothetical protein
VKKKSSPTKNPDREPNDAAPRPRERGDQAATLGYAEDAGHPGGLQNLPAKSDTETEHDAWEQHG